MGESIWNRNLSVGISKPVKTVIVCGLVLGMLYIAAGLALLILKPAGGAAPSEWLPLLGIGMAGLGVIGILAAILMICRVKAAFGLGFAFFASVAMISLCAVVLTVANMTTGSDGNVGMVVGPIGILIGSISALSAICNRETSAYLKGEGAGQMPPRGFDVSQ